MQVLKASPASPISLLCWVLGWGTLTLGGAFPGEEVSLHLSQEDLNEQACDLCRGTWRPRAHLCHIVPELCGSRLASRLGLGRSRRERLCRTPLRLLRPPLLPAVRLCLQLSLRLLPLLARPLLSRLVLGSSAA